MDWLGESQWVLWLAAALCLAVVEVLSLDLVFLMFAGGALVAAVVAGVTDSPLAAVLGFAAATCGLLLLVRPPLLHLLARSRVSLTGAAALVGRGAEVVREVTAGGGQVKLAGEIWSARTEAPGDRLPEGSPVTVVRIEGATAVVSPRNSLPGAPRAHLDGPEA